MVISFEAYMVSNWKYFKNISFRLQKSQFETSNCHTNDNVKARETLKYKKKKTRD
jgi:hypothetical protein